MICVFIALITTTHSQKGYQLKEISQSHRIVYTENTFSLRLKTSIDMFFEDLKRWVVIKMFDKNIPGSNCIREEAILEST